jgi:hypothetical protein
LNSCCVAVVVEVIVVAVGVIVVDVELIVAVEVIVVDVDVDVVVVVVVVEDNVVEESKLEIVVVVERKKESCLQGELLADFEDNVEVPHKLLLHLHILWLPGLMLLLTLFNFLFFYFARMM